MASRIVAETPMEFFREQLEKAMEHQKVCTSAFTEHYLVNLLAGCVKADEVPAAPGYDEMPLAVIYVEALQASRSERARLLRQMGDTALFMSGFFADSLARKLADASYYRAMGGRAYGWLSQNETNPLGYAPNVYSELADRFTEFADVLAEVSESTRLSNSQSILQLYERWVQTGSRRAATLLAEQGIAPVNPGDQRPS